MLSQVVSFTRRFLRQHWDILRHAPSKDMALGLLMTLEKIDIAGADGGGKEFGDASPP
jgi:hypothetical protein